MLCQSVRIAQRKRERERERARARPYLFSGDNGIKTLKNLFVCEALVAQDGATTLESLDDHCRRVARQGKARRVGVLFHRTSQGLLSALCETAPMPTTSPLPHARVRHDGQHTFVTRFLVILRGQGAQACADRQTETNGGGARKKKRYQSASSRMMILCRPGGRSTVWRANPLIVLRTTSMPLYVYVCVRA